MKATRDGGTGRNQVVWVFILTLAVDVNDCDCSFTINTLMELEVVLKKGTDPWLNIYRTVVASETLQISSSLGYFCHPAGLLKFWELEVFSLSTSP